MQGKQVEIKKLLDDKDLLYKKGKFAMIDFQGTRSDYTVRMVFYNITSSGNLVVGDVMSTKNGGEPDSIRKRIAQFSKDSDGTYKWWINDGTGSLSLRVRA